MDTRRILNFRLKQLREERHLSIEELASALDASKGQIVSWEELETDPPVRKLIQMSKYFNCTTDYLLGLSDKRNEEEYKKQAEKALSNSPVVMGASVVLLLLFFGICACLFTLIC